MLKADVIEPCASPWSSNVVLAKKSDGTLRFCIDYRKLNDMTYKDSYPLPRIDTCLDALGGSKYFSTLDPRSGFWQVPGMPTKLRSLPDEVSSGSKCLVLGWPTRLVFFKG